MEQPVDTNLFVFLAHVVDAFADAAAVCAPL